MNLRHTFPIAVTLATAVLIHTSALPAGAQDETTRPAAASGSSAVGEDVMYARLNQFFDLVSEGKVKEAYQALTKGSKSINDIKPLVLQTENVIKGNGQIIDAEPLRTERVGKRLLRISYLTHGEIFPMQWNFYCYRSTAGWQVLDITVNNDLYAIFDEEESAKAKQKEKDKK